MEYRLLGQTGVRVSKLCLGCWMFGTRTDEAESVRLVHAALDAGINFLDTSNRYGRDPANEYGGGVSETYIGRALQERGPAARQQVVLATKVRGAMGPAPNQQGLSRLHIMRAVEDSLRRLRTDYVDLYYLHWPDPDTPLEQSARAMDDLIRAGKVRYWATSNHPAWQVTRAHWLAERYGLEPPVAEQPPYSLLNRGIERELLPCARALGFAVNPYSPLAGGLLTGKYRPGEAPPADLRAASSKMNRFIKQWLTDDMLDAVQRLRAVADAAGVTMSQLALAWVLSQDNVAAAIVGATRPEQVHENARAAGVTLGADTLDAIDDALDPVAVR